MSEEETRRHARKDNPVTVRIHHGDGRVTEKYADGKKVTQDVTARRDTASQIHKQSQGGITT